MSLNVENAGDPVEQNMDIFGSARTNHYLSFICISDTLMFVTNLVFLFFIMTLLYSNLVVMTMHIHAHCDTCKIDS